MGGTKAYEHIYYTGYGHGAMDVVLDVAKHCETDHKLGTVYVCSRAKGL